MQHVMLLTPRAIDIPESVARQFFGSAVVFGALWTDGVVDVREAGKDIRRCVVRNAVQSVAMRHLGTFTAVSHAVMQGTLTDRAEAVTERGLDTVHAAAHTADVFRAYLHVVECAPVLCHAGTESVVVVYSSGARLA